MMDGTPAATRLLCAALALLFLMMSPHAASSPYLETCGADTLNRNGGLSFISIALAVVSLAIALAYMYGKALHNERFEVWAKDEAYNMVITVLLFAGLLAFFAGACGIAEAYTSQSPFAASYGYMDQLLSSSGLTVLRGLTHESYGHQLDATSYFWLGFSPYTGKGVATDANLRSLSAHKEMLADLYLPIVASLNAQKFMLQMIELVSSAVLLPFAFVLRIIPQTRGFGNLLIALFFGLYIMVPTTYAMSAAAYRNVIDNPQSYTGYDFSDWAFGPSAGADSPLYRIGSTLPQAIFIPNLVLVVLITCTAALSKALKVFEA